MANTLLSTFNASYPLTEAELKAEVPYILELAPTEDADLAKVRAAGWQKVLDGFRAIGIDPARYSLQEGVQMHFDSLSRAYLYASLAHLLRLSGMGADNPYSAQANYYDSSFRTALKSVRVVEESESVEVENTAVRGRLTR